MDELLKSHNDLVLLREILARELDTINLYQRMMARTQSPQIATFISHIIDEEKEHVAESMELINSLDRSQASRFGHGSHWQNRQKDSGDERIEAGESSTGQVKSHRFTVGILRGEKNEY
jgi:rubrerythrin